MSLAYVTSCVEMSVTYKGALKPHLDFILFQVRLISNLICALLFLSHSLYLILSLSPSPSPLSYAHQYSPASLSSFWTSHSLSREQVVFPTLCLSRAEAALFESDPVEFIRKVGALNSCQIFVI